jgi:uncharacterized membrane protein (UPF0127 family)
VHARSLAGLRVDDVSVPHRFLDSVFLDRIIAQQDGPGDISPIDRGQPAPPSAFPDERYPTTSVTVNGLNGSRTLDVGHATTPSQRALGLSNLPDAGYNTSGLLMTWPSDATRATLTNRNVGFPVHAIGFDADGRHADDFRMAANDPNPQTMGAPHKHVLEVSPDTADSLGIGPGCTMSLGSDPDSGVGFQHS